MMIATRKLEDDLHITEIGLGTWAIGGPWKYGWGVQDSRESKLAILKALDEGVNWIDTAPAYGLGHAEELVGQVVKNRRKDIIIATKCGIVWSKNRKKISFNNHPDSIRKECEESLKRLNTDYIDLYQIHWPDSKTPVSESWAEMINLKKSGKVKHIGVCNFDLNLLKTCEEMEHITSLQPPYSMLQRDIEKEIMAWCQQNNTGILAYSPLQAGLLTGKFSREYLETLPHDDWRKHNSMFKEPMFSKALAFVREIQKISDKYDSAKTELSSFAVAWILSHSEVTSAIVGVRNEMQGSLIARGAGWKIRNDDMEKIDKIYSEIFQK